MKEDKRIKQIQKLLDVAEGNLHSARNLFLDILGEDKTGRVDHKESARDLSISDEGKIIEGIFDGEQMMSPDGKKYPVPANYASKSKLVEGDTLKLTIAENGSLLYKQIKPVERKNLIGSLVYENGSYSVLAEGKKYHILFASVTYYKGEQGNQASIIVPADQPSTWAALDSIIHDHHKSMENPKKDKQSEGKAEKGVKEKEEADQLELPEENKEILEEVKERYLDDKTQPKESKDGGHNLESPEKAGGEKDIESKQENIKTQTPKKTVSEPADEHLSIKSNPSPFLEEKRDDEIEEKNSLGEDSPNDSNPENVRELEI